MATGTELNDLLKQLIAQNAALLAVQQRTLDQQGKELADLKNTLKNPTVDPDSGVSQYRAMESLASMMDTFVYDEHNGHTFEAWFDRYSGVIEVGAANLGDKGKIELILMKLDPSANSLYRQAIAPKAPGEFSFTDTITKLKSLFRKKVSLLRRRWNCLQMQRRPDEDIVAFGARVNKETEDFQLEKLTPEHFKVLIFILGMQDSHDRSIRTRLLNMQDKDKEEDVTLERMIVEAERILQIERDSGLGSRAETCVVQTNRGPRSSSQHHRSSPQQHQPYRQRSPGKGKQKKPRTACWLCGGLHYVRLCSFKDHRCSRCSVIGHKEGYCDTAKANRPPRNVNIVTVNASTPGSPNDVHAAADVNTPAVHRVDNRKYVTVYIGSSPITLLLDTGCDVTILSEESWGAIGSPALSPPSCRPVDCQGAEIPVLGELMLTVRLNNTVARVSCLVAKCSSLFGNDWIASFRLWDQPLSAVCNQVATPESPAVIVSKLQAQFPSVFERTLGKCANFKASLHLKADARPVFRAKRPMPYHVMALVSEELERLEQSGIITPIEFSNYAAPIVVVRKANGTIRICGDYSTGLNDSLHPHEYPIPTPEQIFASLANTRLFTQLDLSDAYLQVEMDDNSKALLAINTHKGLFTFNRLCPGVKPAAGIFQQTMETVLAGVPGVIIYFDDILIASSSSSDHHKTLLMTLSRLRDFNLKVRFEKCNFFQQEVRYLGVIVDARGQRPDPAKVAAIVSMPAPTSVSETRAFLGAIGFYGRFIPSLSSLRAPLDMLMKKDAIFKWTRQCEEAFQRFKEVLTSDLLLTHYNPTLPIMIAADACNTGIGCVAYHTYPDDSVKAFHHVSRRLTPAEQRYSQIEKEGLGIVYAVKKFHKYLWGRRFTIFTDHRPLLHIFGSPSGIPVHTANRLQRWAIILLGYDFAIKFIGTDDFGHADVLSRLIAEQPRNQEDIIVANVIAQAEEDILTSALKRLGPVSFAEIRTATLSDRLLAMVKDYLENGWPPNRKLERMDVSNYHNLRDELEVVNDVIIYRGRTVVPPPLRRPVLNSLHEAHPGMNRMKALARCFVFWPGIDADIQAKVADCPQCQQAQKSPTKVCLSSWPTPDRPWFRAHADFAGPLNGVWYFIVIDAFSKWPEVYTMKTTTTQATIRALREMTARHGCMEKLVTDNGPQFTSALFADYCKSEGIEHITTAPYMPMSNGLAERFVDTLKRALTKAKDPEEILFTFLRGYRATPNSRVPNGLSPAEILFGRRLRLPLTTVLPPLTGPQDRDVAMERQFNVKHGARDRLFKEGEAVQFRQKPNSEWRTGVIIEAVGKVIYTVRHNNRVVRVHANQLRRVPTISADILYEDSPSPAPAPAPAPAISRPDSPTVKPARKNWRAVERTSPIGLRPRK